mmetsp:Transcript_21991/g.33575  ORF Transcript_21991/g.33575 Transcript_21991/m.33575 type:complete len:335 (+) Transcript_21991:358-1362(+)
MSFDTNGGIMSVASSEADSNNTFSDLSLSSNGALSSESAVSLVTIASVQAQNDYHDDALWMFQQALKIQETQLGSNHIEIAKILTSIGGELRKLDKPVDALETLGKAMRIHQLSTNEGRYPEEQARTLQVIGIVYKRLGDLNMALAAYQDALCLRKLALRQQQKSNENVNDLDQQDSSIDVAILHHNIGNIYYHKRDYVRAMEAYIKSISVNSTTTGAQTQLTKGHIHTANKLYKIGKILCKLDFFDKGLLAYEECLRVYRLTLDPTDGDIAVVSRRIAEIYERKGNLSKALPAYVEALAILLSKLGPNSVDVKELTAKIGSIKAYMPMNKRRC